MCTFVLYCTLMHTLICSKKTDLSPCLDYTSVTYKIQSYLTEENQLHHHSLPVLY